MTNENFLMTADGHSDTSQDDAAVPRSAVSACEIEAILSATDEELGQYLVSGDAIHGAIEEALRNACALTELLTCIESSYPPKHVSVENWSHVAWMASAMIERAQELYSIQMSRDEFGK